ncbi:hypothetical protein FRX31_003784 [Thalictrum thalictroides]|uniref:Uncharacterized protein n=1 Tax=Thalictrum thalictroides TaxID=46969 RepID=A0A7J6XAI2_THATH|nr:hypothetical protein FRX31_003784 [Thalictrum thalictroides]
MEGNYAKHSTSPVKRHNDMSIQCDTKFQSVTVSPSGEPSVARRDRSHLIRFLDRDFLPKSSKDLEGLEELSEVLKKMKAATVENSQRLAREEGKKEVSPSGEPSNACSDRSDAVRFLDPDFLESINDLEGLEELYEALKKMKAEADETNQRLGILNSSEFSRLTDLLTTAGLENFLANNSITMFISPVSFCSRLLCGYINRMPDEATTKYSLIGWQAEAHLYQQVMDRVT